MSNQKETVLLIHGTFASPNTNITQWYQPGSSFCLALDDQLRKQGSQAQCWAHLKSSDPIFHWSGKNSWLEWEKAAERLHECLEKLIDTGWTCHIVAHSHGGQILLQAIRRLDKDKYHNGIGNLVLLGTPLFDTSATRGKSPTDSKKIILFLLSIFLWINWWEWLLYSDTISLYTMLIDSKWYWIALAIVLAVICPIIFFLKVLGLFRRQNGSPHLFPFPDEQPTLSDEEINKLDSAYELVGGSWAIGTVVIPRLLIMNTEHDEAYKLLHHTLSNTNPWEEKYKFSADMLRNIIISGLQIAKTNDKVLFSGPSVNMLSFGLWLLPLTSFFLPPWILMLLFAISIIAMAIRPSSLPRALMLPARLYQIISVVLHSISSIILSIIMPKWGWRWLQLRTAGLAGYPYYPEDIAVSFKPDREGDYEFEELTNAILDQAHCDRRESINDTTSAILSNFLETKEWTPTMIEDLLKQIMSDANLIHAAYYRYPDSIERIAAWIARSEQHRKNEAMSIIRARLYQKVLDICGGFGI